MRLTRARRRLVCGREAWKEASKNSVVMNTLTGGALALVFSYDILAAVLAGPVTPLSLVLTPLASRLEPYFSQDWQLFAPDPVNEDRGALARFDCGDEMTVFVDITSPGSAALQSSRFFPPREARVVSGLLAARFAEGAEADRLRHAGAKKLIERESKLRDQEIARVEELLASVAVEHSPCRADGPQRVQLRYVFHEFASWAQRHEERPESDADYFDSGWVSLP